MPDEPPERYEAGTLPVPAIAGLAAGIAKVKELGIERIAEHERRLFCLAREGLAAISGVRIYAVTSSPSANICCPSSQWRMSRLVSESIFSSSLLSEEMHRLFFIALYARVRYIAPVSM